MKKLTFLSITLFFVFASTSFAAPCNAPRSQAGRFSHTVAPSSVKASTTTTTTAQTTQTAQAIR